MRLLRLALALLLALALPASGLLSHAVKAQQMAAAAENGLCLGDAGDPPADRSHSGCTALCLAAPASDGVPSGGPAAPTPSTAPTACGETCDHGRRIAASQTFDHAARAPPAAA